MQTQSERWERAYSILRLMCDTEVCVSGWRCLPASLSDPPPFSSTSAFHSHGNEAQLQGKPLRSCLSCAGCFYFRHTSWQRLSLSVWVGCVSASVTHLHPAASVGSLLCLSNEPVGKSKNCVFGNTPQLLSWTWTYFKQKVQRLLRFGLMEVGRFQRKKPPRFWRVNFTRAADPINRSRSRSVLFATHETFCLPSSNTACCLKVGPWQRVTLSVSSQPSYLQSSIKPQK